MPRASAPSSSGSPRWGAARCRKTASSTLPRGPQADAIHDASLVKPGFIFVLSTGGSHGHTGLVAEVLPGKLRTIEGNTNDGGSREGIGVFRRDRRKIADISRGFIDYSGL